MEEEETKEIVKSKKNSKFKKEYGILIGIVMAIIVIDQICKIVLMNVGEIIVIPGVLKLAINENYSAAYGIGSNSTIMYVLTNLVILGVIFKFITTQNEFIDTKQKVFLSFIFAGGVTNVIDKIFHGYVIEYIDIKQLINLPVFNLGDIFVIIGWVSVAAIFAGFTVREWRNNKTKKN